MLAQEISQQLFSQSWQREQKCVSIIRLVAVKISISPNHPSVAETPTI